MSSTVDPPASTASSAPETSTDPLGATGDAAPSTVVADPLASTVPSVPVGEAALAATEVSGDGSTPEATGGDTLAVGALVGRYQITGMLGRGGMGVVYAAHDPDLGRDLAIKVLRRELRHARERLLREGQAIARLTHPNVVAVYDVGTVGQDLFVAMELVRGATLGAYFAGRPQPWRDVLARLVPAGRGLAAAHAVGLVHRDFKPDNVLLGEDGRVVVTDFGIAQLDDDAPAPTRGAPSDVREAALTRTGALVGTPVYMSREQLRGEVVDARSDQFSYCAALWEGLAGRRPHAPEATTLEEIIDAVEARRREPLPRTVPRWLAAVLTRGLEPDPVARFPSMMALLDELQPPRTKARIAIAAGATSAVAIGAVAIWSLRADRPAAAGDAAVEGSAAPCAFDVEAARDAWKIGRASHRTRFAAEPWLDEEAAWFDTFAARWADLGTRSCAPAGGVDRACLDRALALFRRAIGRTSTTWPELPALVECAHPAAPPERLAIAFEGTALAQLSPGADRVVVSTRSDAPRVFELARPSAGHPVAGARAVVGWLADGRIVVERSDRALELRADGDATAALATLPAPPAQLPSDGRGDVVSHDGRYRAYMIRDGVAIVRTSDNSAVMTIPGVSTMLSWERGGGRLARTARSQLAIVDPDTRMVQTTSIRGKSDETGYHGLAWLAAGRLVVTSQNAGHEALWELAIGRDGRLASYPELRAEDPEGALMVPDGVGDRVLASRIRLRSHVYRRAAGRVRAFPSSTVGLVLHGFDRARAQLLLAPSAIGAVEGDAARLTTLDGAEVTSVPLAVGAVPALRDGALATLTARGDDVAIAAVGAAPRVLAAPGRYHVLRCHAGRDRCVVAAAGADAGIEITHLTGEGRTVRVPDATIMVDVLADGTVLVPRRDGRVTALATDGAQRDLVKLDGCAAIMVRAAPAGRVLWVTGTCGDHFELGRAEAGRYRSEVSGAAYPNGLEVLSDDDIIYSALDVDAALTLYTFTR